jgi:hydroxymethylbilane synthase
MSLKPALNLGSRASKLALLQSALVRDVLMRAHGFTQDQIAFHPMTTSGDRILDRSLIEAGGKGLFTKEIEEALLSEKIDIAVHSAKDMPAQIPRGLALVACLPREDARDCLIGKKLIDLSKGAIFGTSSPRRAALIRRLRPDLKIVDFRGNVDTRLTKITCGEAEATVLALAGLKRLGMEEAATEIFDLKEFPPAVGQGAIVLEIRENDQRTRALLENINDQSAFMALNAERAYLNVLDGSCRTPIAGYASVKNKVISFHGMLLRPDGSESLETHKQGAAHEAEKLGREAGLELKSRAPADFFKLC